MNDLNIDMHMHVGVVGDKWPEMGKMTSDYISSPVFKSFQLFARIKNEEINDLDLHRKTCEVICDPVKGTKRADHVVCLALAPVYDKNGNEQLQSSKMWVSNKYVRKVCEDTKGKALYGASVHPYDPKFQEKVSGCIKDGAVLLKWLPSAQQIDLADKRVLEALRFLAQTKAGKGGKPLPLLLHVGPEYAIPTTCEKTKSYDYLSWGWMDKTSNFFRFGSKWFVPDLETIYANLRAGLEAGAVIILAHCGLPYLAANIVGRITEHSDFDIVQQLLRETLEKNNQGLAGKLYADVSAFCTPMRKIYFDDVRKLPQERLLYGSDYPTPAFEISANKEEFWDDFKAIMRGEIDRIIIPEDNLLDVNERELRIAFGNSPLFTNFSNLIS